MVALSAALAGAVSWAGGQGARQVAGGPLPLVCAALAFAINWIAFVPAYAARTERYYDLVGSLTYLSLVACAALLGQPDARGALLAGMVVLWALRLGSFLFRRIHQDGSDRRFDAVRGDAGKFLIAWTLQALWVVLTLGCALAAISTPGERELGPLAALGAALWLFGFLVEAVSDAQKRAFRSDPANRGRFVHSGLWAWSRHPNYFGEIVLWVGVALVAWPALSGWQHLSLVSPLFVFLLLTRVSGVPLLERHAEAKWGDDPLYRAYAERTPVLWPRPPRRG